MPVKIFHLEYQMDETITHSYYTSLVALIEDNSPADTFGMPSIHTLQRVKDWPYQKEYKGGQNVKITIRKGNAYTANEIRQYNDTPNAWEIKE